MTNPLIPTQPKEDAPFCFDDPSDPMVRATTILSANLFNALDLLDQATLRNQERRQKGEY